MNELQQWKRKYELATGKKLTLIEGAKLLGISLSYFQKLSYNHRPLTDSLLKKMDKILCKNNVK